VCVSVLKQSELLVCARVLKQSELLVCASVLKQSEWLACVSVLKHSKFLYQSSHSVGTVGHAVICGRVGLAIHTGSVLCRG